jgi:hypothetical protein
MFELSPITKLNLKDPIFLKKLVITPDNRVPTGNRRLLNNRLTGCLVNEAGWQFWPTGYPAYGYWF